MTKTTSRRIKRLYQNNILVYTVDMKNIRHIEAQLEAHFRRYKQAIVLLGARQVGKTTLLKRIFPEALYLLVDNEEVKKTLETYDIHTYKQILGAQRQVIIDELHLLSDPGRAVKIMYDQIEGVQIIVTGSSSLHIKNKSSESMAGRKLDYYLYPLTFSEFLVQSSIENDLNSNILRNILDDTIPSVRLFSSGKLLEGCMSFGLYPEIIQLPQDKEYLRNLADTAIFKDILELDLIDNKAKARDLLKLLAYQIGNLINYSELANTLGINARTVQRYIEIFEQSYILYRVYPYSQNKRSEIGKTPKVYFYDLGIRNALINNFDNIAIRPDAGAMFENFIFSELRKLITYEKLDFELNYWRLKSGAEVDIVLSNRNTLIGCEVKLTKGKVTSAFTSRYPQAKTRVVTSSNFY